MNNLLLGGQFCTDKVNITFDESNTKEVGRNKLAIVPRLNFTCNGRITGIMAKVKELGGDDGSNAILQVWRQGTDGAKIYNKISEATLTLQSSNSSNGNDRIANFTFAGNKTIDVQLGDVVGYYHPQRSQYVIKDKETIGYILYEFEEFPSMNSVNLSTSSNIRNDRQPLIQFSMSKCVFLL